MKVNIGTVDRVIRGIVGVVIIGLGIRSQSWWGLIGLLPLLTAAVRFCPAYVPFGLSTCPSEQQKPVLPPDGPKPA
jgi:Protein of unknown function (DUF2892)